jgi:hypothetical protein
MMRYCELGVPILRILGTWCSVGLNISHPQSGRLRTSSPFDVFQVSFVNNLNPYTMCLNASGLKLWLPGIPEDCIDSAFSGDITAGKIRYSALIFYTAFVFKGGKKCKSSTVKCLL